MMERVADLRPHLRTLGRTGLLVSPIGFGALKIGRNQKVKYPGTYDLPALPEVERLLNGLLDAGINLIDTAPAYGLSEARIGQVLAHRRNEFVLSTKVGEIFENGESRYDFRAAAVRASIDNSLRALRTDRLDLVLIHAHSEDVAIQTSTDVVAVLSELKQAGLIRAIGLSAKTIAGAEFALDWADVLMLEYHLQDASFTDIIRAAAARGVGILVKKGLASGSLSPEESIDFVLGNPDVSSLVIGSLNADHMRANLARAKLAGACRLSSS